MGYVYTIEKNDNSGKFRVSYVDADNNKHFLGGNANPSMFIIIEKAKLAIRDHKKKVARDEELLWNVVEDGIT